MINQVKKESISQTLLTTIKEDVFNEPFLELFNNVKIHKLSSATNYNYFIYKNTTIRLPGNGSVILYKLNFGNVSGLIFSKDENFPYKQTEWIPIKDYCNTTGLTFDIFDNQNRLVHQSAVKVNTIMSTNTLYLAIDSSLLYNLNYNYNFLYVNVYRDSNAANDKTTYTYNHIDDGITKIDEIINVSNAQVDKEKLYIYINGYYYTYDQFEDFMNENYADILSLALYIDLYNDENVYISHSFSIDDLKYYTNDSLIEKYILHIPKSLNPTKKMFTFNTMDIFLVDTEKGIKYTYFDDTSITQLTFNDISINKSIVDTMIESFGDKNIELKIRYYEKNNVLERNKPLDDLLYSYFTDEEIIDILSENFVDDRMNCIWGGKHLEATEYIKALFEFPIVSDNDTFISKCVNILGYYKTIELINNLESEYTNLNTTDLQVEKSLFYKTELLYPLITKNGLLESDFSFVQDDDYIDITLGTQAIISDQFHVKTLPELKSDYTYFTPISGDDLITIIKTSSLMNIKVFLETTDSSEIEDIDGTFPSPTYAELDLIANTYFSITESDTDLQIQFNPSAYNLNFTIVHDDHFTYHIQKLNVDLTTETEFSFILETPSSNPLLYIPCLMVFLNDHILVEGVDFHLVEFKNIDGSIGGYRLVIQNINHLEALNNVDVFITSLSDHSIFKQRHFQYNDTISCDNKLDTNLGNMFISTNGNVINKDEYENRNTVLINLNTFPESSVYSFDMHSSKSIKDWLSPMSNTTNCDGSIYTEDEQFDYIRQRILTLRDMIGNIDILMETFSLTTPDEDVLLQILSECDDITPTIFYDIHSSYVNRIVQMIDDGTIIIPPSIYNSENPDPNEIEALLSTYEYLKIFDLVLANNNIVGKYVNIVLAYDENLILNAPNGTDKIIDYIKLNYFNFV